MAAVPDKRSLDDVSVTNSIFCFVNSRFFVSLLYYLLIDVFDEARYASGAMRRRWQHKRHRK